MKISTLLAGCLIILSFCDWLNANAAWKDSSYRTTLQNGLLEAEFQAGNLFRLRNLVNSQTLLYKDPNNLAVIIPLFGQTSVNLDSADITQNIQSDSVQTTYSWSDGTTWSIDWSNDGEELVMQTSAQSPVAVDGFYINLTGCDMTNHSVTAIDGYGACHTMTTGYTGALMSAHGGTQKYAMPWSFCQPMVVLLEGTASGWVIEGRDPDIGPSNIRPFGEGQTADVIISRAFPETLATQTPALFEVRIRTYNTVWQDAVDPYIAWMKNDAGFVPLDQKTYSWIQDIHTQTYLTVGNYDALNAFDQRYDATKTYLGRQAEYRYYAFDKGYPDFNATPAAALWIAYARSLGFHVGVHTNIAAIDRDDIALIAQMEPGLLQIGTDGNGDPIWAGTSTHVYCSPAYPPWRAEFISRIANVVAAGADVIYLDEAGPLGKFVVDGVTATQGVMIMEQEIMDAYPGVVIQTEGMNPCISRHAYLALIQHPPVHQLSGYILGTFIKIAPEGYMYSPVDLQNFDDYTASGYILPGTDTSRSESWQEILDVFQQFNFVANSRLARSANQFSGFSGSNQVQAYFEKTDTSRYLIVYEPYHAPEKYGVRYTNIKQWPGPGYIEDWLIYNENMMYGLDPNRTYWFDETVTLDSTKFHITSVPLNFLPYQDDSRRTIPQEIGFNHASYRVFFSGSGQLNMFVPDDYDVYLDSQAVTVNRQTDTAAVNVSATQQGHSVIRAFQRSQQLLEGYWAQLNWTTPPQKWGTVDTSSSLYQPYGFYNAIPGEGFIFGKFPRASSIRIQGSWGMRDDARIRRGDGVITINGTEVMRLDPGQGPPYDMIPFDIDITSFSGQYAMLEFFADGHMSGVDYSDWDAPQIVVSGIIPDPQNCAEAITQGYGLAEDFSGNCYIDFADLLYLAQDWLHCMKPQDPNCEHPW